MLKKWVMAVVLVIALAYTAWAAIPQTISYQGYLKNTDGTPVNGTRTMTFAIYDMSSGAGAPLWAESQSVATTDGIFSVHLGSVSPLPASLFDNASLYLGISVESDPEMTPRQQLTTAPFSFRAATADSVTSLAPGAVATANLADSSVTAPKIADGAVTDAKISGTIAGSKLGSHSHSGNDITGGAIADAYISSASTWNAKLSAVAHSPSLTGDGTAASPLDIVTVPSSALPASVVSTSGSYADPAWITSLAGSKITGNIAGNAATATTATTAASFSGALSGDVTGTQGSTTVTKIQGRPVSSTGPATGQVLKWNGTTSAWEPAADNNSGGTVTNVTGSGPISVANGTTTPVISLAQASATTSGYLSSGDWQTFNSKLAGNAAAGGDLSGTLPSPAVARIQGRPVSSTAPVTGQTLKWDGTQWTPTVDSNSGGTVTSVTAGAGLYGGTITGSGTIGIASRAVINTMLSNSSLTVAAGTGLAGGGTVELGSGTTLYNTGVLNVSVSAPLTSSGGQTPNIALDVVPVANGGTGSGNGSINGTGSLAFVAGGTSNNVYLVPSGSGSVDVTNKRITSIAPPTAPTDAATKGYVDAAMVSGCVNSNGSVAYGSGFSSSQTGTGSYTITFSQSFPSSPAVVVTPITGTGAMACQLLGMNPGSAGVVCVTGSNAQVATAFCFMAR